MYVSRHDYRKIFLAFLAVGVPLGALGVLLPSPLLLRATWVVAAIGVALLLYSLVGLYRMYGHPSTHYYRGLLQLGNVQGPVVVADLHIGTYRTAFALAELLPGATIHTVDCWNVGGPPAEPAIADVRALEPAPAANPRIRPARATAFALPLADASCDVVVFGFGTHEIPVGGPRERLFGEAKRVLKPGGTLLLFEHGKDWHNYVIFGPVIEHVTRREEWQAVLERDFDDVRYARSSAAVDLFSARRRA